MITICQASLKLIFDTMTIYSDQYQEVLGIILKRTKNRGARSTKARSIVTRSEKFFGHDCKLDSEF